MRPAACACCLRIWSLASNVWWWICPAVGSPPLDGVVWEGMGRLGLVGRSLLDSPDSVVWGVMGRLRLVSGLVIRVLMLFDADLGIVLCVCECQRERVSDYTNSDHD